MISVLILTKNEEVNIARCIDSVAWADDVVVFDSESTDRTVELAEAAGARVFSRPFDNYGAQREAARRLDYKNEWVLALDADERPDPELSNELKQIAAAGSPHAAYRLRRKDYFMGRWIKHCTLYPSWFVRFYRPDRIEYEPRAVHEYPRIDGSVGELTAHLLHDSFSKGLEEWYLKHVRYATLEAQENLRSLGEGSGELDPLGTLQFRDPVRRRRALKTLSFRLPCRPLLRFLYSYVARGGFIDGGPGYCYCTMLASYEAMIVSQLKYIEWERNHCHQKEGKQRESGS